MPTTLVITNKAGQVIEPGAIVTDFRGDEAKLIKATRAAGPGYSGKVRVEYPATKERQAFSAEYYSGVFSLEVTDPEEAIAAEAIARDEAGLAPRDSSNYGR